MQIDHGVGLGFLHLVQELAEGSQVVFRVVVAQLIHAEGDVHFSELGPLLQGLHNGVGLAVHGHQAGVIHPEDAQAGVVVEGGALDAAVQPQSLGAGVADKQGVGKVVHIHRHPVGHRLGKVKGRGGGRRGFRGGAGGHRGGRNGVGSLREGTVQYRDGH